MLLDEGKRRLRNGNPEMSSRGNGNVINGSFRRIAHSGAVDITI